jgi:hypothetical protein
LTLIREAKQMAVEDEQILKILSLRVFENSCFGLLGHDTAIRGQQHFGQRISLSSFRGEVLKMNA